MRTISFGEPAPGLVRACEQAVAAQEHTFSLMKAGVACSDIYAEYRKYMDDKGLAADTRLYSHGQGLDRSEEHTSELQSLMRITYAVFCLKKTKTTKNSK